VVRTCDHSNEILDIIKCPKFVPNNYELMKEDSCYEELLIFGQYFNSFYTNILSKRCLILV
jgi:hypothetical protein